MTAKVILTAEELKSLLGQELGPGDWLTVTQAMIDGFAAASGDAQWIHCDPQRAAAESPYGRPIAHGFLTLSLATQLLEQLLQVRGATLTVNYGLDRVRFPQAVPVDARVRLSARLEDAAEVAGGVQTRLGLTIEVEGEPKPACAAQWLLRFYFE